MHFKPRLLPAPYGQLPEAFSYSPYSPYSPYSNEIPISLPYDLIRLHQEKDILSKGLADCVTYLKALREKQAKNARQLNVQPPLPPKKRKWLQQMKRHLNSEIKNRERAEQAFLNNLQACETNIYLANMKAYQLSNASFQASGSTSTPNLYTPTLCSYPGSETTDLTWEGWTDEAVVSPFQKKSSNPFIVDDLAPDVCIEDLRRDSAVAKDVKRPPPLCRDAVKMSDSLPVPPNTAHSQYRRSSFLSPAAAVFKPTYSSIVQQSSLPQSNIKGLSMSSSTATDTIEIPQKRRFSAAEIVPVMEHFNIVAQSSPQHLPGHQTRDHTAPQPCAQKDGRPRMNRQRINSL